MAGGPPRRLPRRRPGHHPRPLLPRQRRGVDPRARPRQDAPLRGQLLDVPRDQEGPPQDRGPEGRQARQDAREASSSGCAPTPRPARPRASRVSPATRRWRPRPTGCARSTPRRSTSRPGPRLGDVVLEADDLAKGFDDRTLIHDLSFTLPRAGIVGVIGPNGVGKTTLFRMITGEEKPDARRARGRPDGEDLLRRPEPRRHRPQQERLGGRLRRARLHQGRQLRDELARLRRLVRLQGPRPAEEGGRPVRW